MSTSLFSKTPTVKVFDNRGLTVRNSCTANQAATGTAVYLAPLATSY